MQIVRQNFETSFVVKKDVSHALIHALRPTIPILIVFDGEIETHPGSGFSLSKLIDLLERPPSLLALRGRFGVVLAERGHGQPQTNPNPQRYEPKYSRFRFNMQGFDLTRFHEVWLFGWASEGDLDLAPEELSILASWMNAGGGVFATGDHDTHGASLSGSILRLRSMRRWRHDQNPPPGSGRQRRETTQPAIAGQGVTGEGGPIPVLNEQDAFPKPITPTFLSWTTGPDSEETRVDTVHPLLCHIGGPITVLPDHPHEGEVIDYHGVRFDRGEFPGVDPVVVAMAHSGAPLSTDLRYESDAMGERVDRIDFPVVGAYDGQRAGVGRIVVDSGLHHWLDQNLGGFTPETLATIQSYHLNVAVWLARSEDRIQFAAGGIMTAMLAYPGLMDLNLNHRTLHEVGRGVSIQLQRVMSPCEIATTTTRPEWNDQPDIDRREPDLNRLPRTCLSCPPAEDLTAYTLGGIAESLIGVISNYRKLDAKDIDPKNVREQVAKAIQEGRTRGRMQFVTDLKESFKKSGSLVDKIEKLTKESS